MNDFYDEPSVPGGIGAPMTANLPAPPDTVSDSVQGPEVSPPVQQEPEPAAETKQEPPEESPAVTRFNSCRWHEAPENEASYCANRDVLPFAGKNGFNPEAWCPDCAFYKVKRTVKKRTPNDWDDY